jgi:hypothetical protein
MSNFGISNATALFFILYYRAGYVNMLQLLMDAGYAIFMNMS